MGKWSNGLLGPKPALAALPEARHKATRKSAASIRPCSWGWHLSAAHGWFLSPLNCEMSVKAKFSVKMSLISHPVAAHMFSVLIPLSRNPYGLFSCHSLLFCLTCSQEGFSPLSRACLKWHELRGLSARPGARRKAPLTNFVLKETKARAGCTNDNHPLHFPSPEKPKLQR